MFFDTSSISFSRPQNVILDTSKMRFVTDTLTTLIENQINVLAIYENVYAAGTVEKY